MSTEIIVAPLAQKLSLFEMQPQQMIAAASEMAKTLADVIQKQNLFSDIQGKRYVKIEGWATLGTLLGFLPREVSVIELEDGSYEAKVELYNIKTGHIVGQASSLCGIDEPRWKSAARYARRSMAVTRATGKAYRLGFAWIVALAGYEATPMEEMHDELPVQKVYPIPKTDLGYDPKNDGMRKALQKMLEKRKISDSYFEAISAKLVGKPSSQIDQIIDEVTNATN